MNMAIIPARGGSKRIYKKNIREFCGKPMIVWSIEAALASACFDHVMVSTDDDEIAEVAIAHGAAVPFRRPAELANDMAGTMPVIAHAIEWSIAQGLSVDYACCIYATAPFVRAEDLVEGLNIIKATGSDYTFSVTSFPYPVQRALRINSDAHVEMLYPELFNTRSQDLEETFHDAGQFYWGKASAWQRSTPIFLARSAPIVLPRYRVQDIDTLEDWESAEWLFRSMQARKRRD